MMTTSDNNGANKGQYWCHVLINTSKIQEKNTDTMINNYLLQRLSTNLISACLNISTTIRAVWKPERRFRKLSIFLLLYVSFSNMIALLSGCDSLLLACPYVLILPNMKVQNIPQSMTY